MFSITSKYSRKDRQIAMQYVELVAAGDRAGAKHVLARAGWTEEHLEDVLEYFSPRERTDKLAAASVADDAPVTATAPVTQALPRVYTEDDILVAIEASRTRRLRGTDRSAMKQALKRLKAAGLSWDDVIPALEQGMPDEGEDEYTYESAPEPEYEAPRQQVEVVEPASAPHGVERMVVPVPVTYRDTLEERAKLIAALWRKLGAGWQVEKYDRVESAGMSSVHIVRGELPAMRPGKSVYLLGPSATTGNGSAIAAEHAAYGRTMLSYDPYKRQAVTAVLPPATMELRDRLLRKNPRQKSWELELLPIFGVRDGVGFLAKVIITRADQSSPDRDKEIAYWLGLAKNTVGHSGWWVSVDDARGVIEMTAGIPISMPSRVGYDYDVIQNGKWGELVVGRDGYNKPVVVDLAATPHALVVGRTGSGKSIFLQTMIFSALAHGFEVAILDPTKEGLDFRCFQPYVRDGGWGCESFPEALAVLEDVYEEARRRKKVLSALSAPKWLALSKEDQVKHGIKPILVVVDEGTALAKLATLPKLMDKESPKYIELAEENMAKEQIMYYVGRILRECRFVGIHLVFGTQRFGIQEIGQGAGELRENMGARIILGRSSTTSLAMACADPQDAAAAYEQAHGSAVIQGDPSITGREPTPGRGLAEIDGRGHVALQGAFAEAEELVEQLTAMGVPAYEGDRRPVVPEKESPFGVVESAPVYSVPVPAVPEVKELGELELSLEDLQDDDDTTVVEAPKEPELDWDASLTTAAPEAPEPDWRAFAVPAVAQDDEDPFAAPAASPRPPVLDDDEDMFAEPKAKPRPSIQEDDLFGKPVPAKPKPKVEVEAFDW
ncbi:hypothetical protein ASH00_15755 [Arthrobacter sp. Soil782]|uniref:FtsK/SpoIIIE domain-containing protein n=1 Tax=Arthrobacter sp. Soil782 TaxID=1736410 RepID=UPI0006F5E834|nr:FtsK/SpoIIIE domain-containing protein [Arthrobacter sp. Soil782]KRF03239.1 hypothetical protein ASH00_15755 [Arthrobacter sp. Soil782]